MNSESWLSIIGLGEDGLEGLCDASRRALDAADIVFGAERHLKLVGAGDRGHAWPVPFDLSPLLAQRGQAVAALVSGDPFWHGAGSSIARHLPAHEWRAFPQPSSLSLAAARLGWPLEQVTTLGLHAAPFARLLPHLARGCRILCTLRDGAAPPALAKWLCEQGLGEAILTVFEAVGGKRERLRTTTAKQFELRNIETPVALAIDGRALPRGSGLPRGFGLPDNAFVHDGQISRRNVRALTLSALAPRVGEHLWDLGAGAASVAIEWCLNGGTASAVERNEQRIANIETNIAAFGLQQQLTCRAADHADCLAELPRPDAVFVGGGASADLIDALWQRIPQQCRLLVNAVTLETEALLIEQQACRGGSLLRIELSSAAALGSLRGWQAERAIVQWSVSR